MTVKGKPDPETGFVVDMKKLSTLIRQNVIEKLDHKNINLDVDFMQGKMASCENLIVEIWKIIVRGCRTSLNSQGEYSTQPLYRILWI